MLLSGAYGAASPYASLRSYGVAVLLRADDSGALDASFGRGGYWTSHPNGSWDFGSLNLGFSALATQSTGALIGARSFYGSDELLGVRLRIEELLP